MKENNNEFLPFYFKTLDSTLSPNVLKVNETAVLGYLCALYDRLKTNNQLLEGKTFYCSSSQIEQKTTLTERQIKPILETLRNEKIGLIDYNVSEVGAKRVFSLKKLANVNLKEKKFYPVPISLIKETTLHSAIFISFLAYLERLERLYCRQISSSEIEKKTGLSKHQQAKAAQILAEAGYLEKENNPNYNVFILSELYLSKYPLFENKPKEKPNSKEKPKDSYNEKPKDSYNERVKEIVSEIMQDREAAKGTQSETARTGANDIGSVIKHLKRLSGL